MLINIFAAYSKYKSTAKTCLHGCSHHISYAQKRNTNKLTTHTDKSILPAKVKKPVLPLKQNKPTILITQKAGLIILIPLNI